MTRIAILGAGPAGLFAAHGAKRYGAEVDIYSKEARKSFMRGAQYLHQPIPGLSGDPFLIDYTLEGSVEGYRDKVYGDMSDVLVSPQSLLGIANAWDIREAYDNAWEEYGSAVIDFDFSILNNDQALLDMVDDYDAVFSSIPAKVLCQRPEAHSFLSQKIWSTDFVKTTDAFRTPEGRQIDNMVLCSGDPDDWWYRQSRIQGWENTEFPHNRRPHTDRVWEVEKPISTDCDCHPRVWRVGRYGIWRKGVLSHTAYDTAQEIVRRQL